MNRRYPLGSPLKAIIALPHSQSANSVTCPRPVTREILPPASPIYGLRCIGVFAFGFRIGLRTIYPVSGCRRRVGLRWAVCPSGSLPPLECGRGVIPSQTAKHLPFLNTGGSPTVTTNPVAICGPIVSTRIKELQRQKSTYETLLMKIGAALLRRKRLRTGRWFDPSTSTHSRRDRTPWDKTPFRNRLLHKAALRCFLVVVSLQEGPSKSTRGQNQHNQLSRVASHGVRTCIRCGSTCISCGPPQGSEAF